MLCSALKSSGKRVWGEEGNYCSQRGPRGHCWWLQAEPRCPWSHTAPEPPRGILIKLNRLIQLMQPAAGRMRCAGWIHVHPTTLPVLGWRIPAPRGAHTDPWGRCPVGIWPPRSWRGRELFLQHSSFSFSLRAALPSVIKIYQCEPKHLALHLLL